MRLSIRLFAPAVLATLGFAAPAAAQQAALDRIEAIHGDAAGFEEVFDLVTEAMEFGDPTTVSPAAFYPLTVQANGEAYDLFSADDLLENYDALVTAETQSAVAQQSLRDLVVTSEGVGLANGALWMANVCLDEGCAETRWGITAINN